MKATFRLGLTELICACDAQMLAQTSGPIQLTASNFDIMSTTAAELNANK